MSDVIGADMDPGLSVAYRALERRREDVIVQRDRIADELKKLDVALEALRALAEDGPERAANGRGTTYPAAGSPEAAETTKARTGAAPKEAAQTARSPDRKVRIIEFLLENPRQWFTMSEIVALTEQANASAAQRNAVSEALRRLLRRGAVQRDETGRPVRYRAVSTVLRELLLAAQ
jgi:hypothetical protein